MRDFIVCDLVDGWEGQAASLADAIAMRDDLAAATVAEGFPSEWRITCTVDEDDLALIELIGDIDNSHNVVGNHWRCGEGRLDVLLAAKRAVADD